MYSIAISRKCWTQYNRVNYKADSSTLELFKKDKKHLKVVKPGEVFNREKHTVFVIDGEEYMLVGRVRVTLDEVFRCWTFSRIGKAGEVPGYYGVDLLVW